LDGDTALKYARSRHTTSDFSRSQRQQQLIKAIMDKLLQKENLTNIDTLRELYDTYTRMVKTNISSKEMI
jgi:anionic cell wall polymer biosynthesis LytR-Cps2A-Psr (LCP) family protein